MGLPRVRQLNTCVLQRQKVLLRAPEDGAPTTGLCVQALGPLGRRQLEGFLLAPIPSSLCSTGDPLEKGQSWPLWPTTGPLWKQPTRLALQQERSLGTVLMAEAQDDRASWPPAWLPLMQLLS